MSVRFAKILDVDEEMMGDELVLLHRKTLAVKVLNETATILWDALPEFPTVESLVSLLMEAYPDHESPASYLSGVTTFLEELTTAGFLVREEPPIP